MILTFCTSLQQRFTRLIYSLLWLILTPLLICKLLFSQIIGKHGYTLSRWSRFGLIGHLQTSNTLMIHCASVGEVVAIQHLVKYLLKHHPAQTIVITTNTTTGADRVQLLFDDLVLHYYLPYDFPLFLWLFLKKVKPNKVLINEMELWPNLCAISHTLDIPIFIVNGRMSDKSTKTYKKFPALFSPMLLNITHICAQGDRDFSNYLKLGIPATKLTLTNNIKFELEINSADLVTSKKILEDFSLQNRRIIVAGSTHAPEEQELLAAYLRLKEKYHNLLLIIVPRHPQRFDKVHQLLKKQAGNVNLMSEMQPSTNETQVLLCDQMGKLTALYALANIAFIGGSIAKRGGHNALEAAAYNVPILMGPSSYNNPEIQQALADAGALKTVTNSAQIQQTCEHWFDNPKVMINDGNEGGKVLQQNKGAIAKTIQALNL